MLWTSDAWNNKQQLQIFYRPLILHILHRRCVDLTQCRFIQPYPVMTRHDFHRLNPRVIYRHPAVKYVDTVFLRNNIHIQSRLAQLWKLCFACVFAPQRINEKDESENVCLPNWSLDSHTTCSSLSALFTTVCRKWQKAVIPLSICWFTPALLSL